MCEIVFCALVTRGTFQSEKCVKNYAHSNECTYTYCWLHALGGMWFCAAEMENFGIFAQTYIQLNVSAVFDTEKHLDSPVGKKPKKRGWMIHRIIVVSVGKPQQGKAFLPRGFTRIQHGFCFGQVQMDDAFDWCVEFDERFSYLRWPTGQKFARTEMRCIRRIGFCTNGGKFSTMIISILCV